MSVSAGLPTPGAGERRAAARGVAWGGVESAATAAAGLLLTPIVVRCAGLPGLGLWGAAWSLAHTAGLFDLGVGASYGRFVARALARRDLADLNATLAAGSGFHILLSILLGLPALLLGPRLLAWAAPDSPRLPEARIVLACTLLTVLLRGSLSAYRAVVGAAQRLDLLARLGALAAVVEGCLGALVLLRGHGLSGLAIASLAVGSAALFVEACLAHHLCPGLRLRPFVATGVDYRHLLAFGSRLQATRASEILGSQLPRLLLAAGPGLAAAGVYDLGARVAGLVPLLASLPLRVIVPLAAHLEARGEPRRLQALLSRSTRYVALLALPPAVLILLQAESLLLAWTGDPAPPGAAAAARCLAVATTIVLLASPLRLLLRGCGQAGVEAAATTCGTLLHLGLAVPLCLSLGAAGVAGAALPGAALQLLILVWGARRGGESLLPGTATRALAGPFGASVAMLLGGAFLEVVRVARLLPGPADRLEALSSLAWRAPILGALFLLSGAILGGLQLEDLSLLRPAPKAAESEGGTG